MCIGEDWKGSKGMSEEEGGKGWISFLSNIEVVFKLPISNPHYVMCVLEGRGREWKGWRSGKGLNLLVSYWSGVITSPYEEPTSLCVYWKGGKGEGNGKEGVKKREERVVSLSCQISKGCLNFHVSRTHYVICVLGKVMGGKEKEGVKKWERIESPCCQISKWCYNLTISRTHYLICVLVRRDGKGNGKEGLKKSTCCQISRWCLNFRIPKTHYVICVLEWKMWKIGNGLNRLPVKYIEVVL